MIVYNLCTYTYISNICIISDMWWLHLVTMTIYKTIKLLHSRINFRKLLGNRGGWGQEQSCRISISNQSYIKISFLFTLTIEGFSQQKKATFLTPPSPHCQKKKPYQCNTVVESCIHNAMKPFSKEKTAHVLIVNRESRYYCLIEIMVVQRHFLSLNFDQMLFLLKIL